MVSFRSALLATTILSGIVGISLVPPAARAADVPVKAPVSSLPAVDGLNTTFDLFGGSMASHGIGGVVGTMAVPLGHRYGFQIDGVASSYRGDFLGGIGAHLFWRDPSQGMLGLYGAHTRAEYVGVHVNHIAAEFESYRGRWTLQGIVGRESGGGNFVLTDGFNFTGTGHDVKGRFFDKINFNYYLNDNAMLTVGHRYVGGKHALALGGEWAFPKGSRTLPAFYLEGRIGEDDYRAVWAGIRFYNGQKDKSLIRRHREDDPINWIPETLFGILNNFGLRCVPGAVQVASTECLPNF